MRGKQQIDDVIVNKHIDGVMGGKQQNDDAIVKRTRLIMSWEESSRLMMSWKPRKRRLKHRVVVYGEESFRES